MATLIGTSGFHYEEWKGILYPEDLPKQDYLRYYSLFFPFVELDFSYWRMPDAWRLEALANSVPKDFLFSIKAHRSLTNESDRMWPRVAAELRSAVEVRGFRDRLAAVLLQFPHRFAYTDPNRVYLGELTRELADLPLFLEFRASEWNCDAVLEEAERRGLGIVSVYSPDVDPAPRDELFVVNGCGYLRFHSGSWWDTEKINRHDYSHSDAELQLWRPKILTAEEKSQSVFVSFNNYGAGNAIRDARRFKGLLDATRPRGLSPRDGDTPV